MIGFAAFPQAAEKQHMVFIKRFAEISDQDIKPRFYGTVLEGIVEQYHIGIGHLAQ